MNGNHIKEMFIGIDDYTKDYIVRNLKTELGNAIKGVNAAVASTGGISTITPQPAHIMEAPRRCSFKDLRVVIIGQDPFIKVGEAQGLCFSVPKGVKTPPSTTNIYKCLQHCKLMDAAPAHGNLEHWAAQGVLMLNSALTTVIGTSNKHKDEWAPYTDGMIRQITSLPQRVIFILLGTFAIGKESLVNKSKDVVLTWGHPSPMSTVNKIKDNPKNFTYCDVFLRTNEILIGAGQPPVIWDVAKWDPAKYTAPIITYDVIQPLRQEDMAPVATAATTKIEPATMVANPNTSSAMTNTILMPTMTNTIPTTSMSMTNTILSGECGLCDPTPPPNNAALKTLWIFTDGGATANGKPNCKASWAYYMTDGVKYAKASARVEPKDIPGCRFKSSNNRGELTAILRALEYILVHHATYKFGNIIIVSDSDLSIKGIDVRSTDGKKNVDLLEPAKATIAQVRNIAPTTFKHVNASHDVNPPPIGSLERFLYNGNKIVDSMCNVVLGLDDNKKRLQ